MKIFLSHSSYHKPLVREVKQHLPEHVRSWIDETELLIGDNIKTSIREAIRTETDFVILFVDRRSVQSSWVQEEITWAMEHELQIGRTFVLPILLEPDAWNDLHPISLQGRKYIECFDFTEGAIRSVAHNLTSHLFAWISRDRERSATNTNAGAGDLLSEADQYLNSLAIDIRAAVHHHNRDNPLPLRDLYHQLKSRPETRIDSESMFNNVLARLRQQGYLAGLVSFKDTVFVEEEHYGWKTTIYSREKEAIAQKAIEFIDSGATVLLDSGSTTIQIARQISQGIKFRSWTHLRIITNSISAAHELLTTASEIGLEDENDVLDLCIIGGRVRCNTLAVVSLNYKSIPQLTDFDAIVGTGGADIAFVGANGIEWDKGFTTHANLETATKAAMLRLATRRFIVIDASKFKLKQSHVFASFDQGLEVITTSYSHESEIQDYGFRLAKRNTKLILAD